MSALADLGIVHRACIVHRAWCTEHRAQGLPASWADHRCLVVSLWIFDATSLGALWLDRQEPVAVAVQDRIDMHI